MTIYEFPSVFTARLQHKDAEHGRDGESMTTGLQYGEGKEVNCECAGIVVSGVEDIPRGVVFSQGTDKN